MKSFLIGLTVSANHPITCANPARYFKIFDVNIDHGKLYVRGEHTMWFESGLITLQPSIPIAELSAYLKMRINCNDSYANCEDTPKDLILGAKWASNALKDVAERFNINL